MRVRFFTVAVGFEEASAQELNQFLASHRVVSFDRHLTQLQGSPVWAICVGFESDGESVGAAPPRSRVDYRELLNSADFEVFSTLRRLRKEIADREGLSLYQVFTNEQLATLVRDRIKDRTRFAEVDGVGPKKLERWGDLFIAKLREIFPESTVGDRSPSTPREAEREEAPQTRNERGADRDATPGNDLP